MISKDFIKKIATKYQTTEQNIVREYFQHLFLEFFYQQPIASSIYFKGGTALRIIYHSPRFSEDLDFSAERIKINELEQAILLTLDQIEKQNIQVLLKEAKTTTGGYLANIYFEALDLPKILIQLEIYFRQGNISSEIVTISSDFVPPYIAHILAEELLIEEKIKALLFRKKPRDFYDLYFIMRSNLLPPAKKKILQEVFQVLKKTKINFENELKIYLPKTHWALIRDFKNILEREVKRYII